MKIFQSVTDGSIYWLEDDTLLCAPLSTTDSIVDLENDGIVVDWFRIDEEYKKHLLEIQKKLQ